jgi:transcriptional regulator with XRE-family HTH domain
MATPEQAFGAVVRQLREERGLSQEQLSFACGRHRTYVSLIERGRNSPSLRTLWLLADALGVPPSEMIRRTEGSQS